MSGYNLECQNCPLAASCTLLSKPFKPMEAVATVSRVLSASRGPVKWPRPPRFPGRLCRLGEQ